MGVLVKAVDAILLVTFFIFLVIFPLDVQVFLPDSIIPNLLKQLYQWYTMNFPQDYLVIERPHFFVSLMVLEIFYQFPLAMLNIYGMLTTKPWFNSTCIIFGASLMTSTTAMVGDIVGSDKPLSDKATMMFSPFIALGVLAILRGSALKNKA